MIRFHEALEPLMVPKRSIQPHPENYNEGDIEEITASVLEDGCYRPIYISARTRNIVGGTNLYYALDGLGCEMVPALPLNLSEDAERRILIKDNLIAKQSKFIDHSLLALLDRVTADGRPLVGLGIDERGLDSLRVRVEDQTPLRLNLTGSGESLVHTITCPDCGHKWTRGTTA